MITTELKAIFNNLPNRIIATVHKDPDYDAIGSLLAFNELIKSLNGDVTLLAPDMNKKQFQNLPGIKNIQTTPKSEYDLAFFLDCSDKNRIFKPKSFPAVKKMVNIDHHQDNTLFGDINIVKNISSVGELLFNLFIELNIDISIETATNLYAAICFDTGNFKFSNTTASTFITASKLLEKGVNASKISEWIFEQKPKNYFHDVREGLNNMHIDSELPFMIVHIPNHPNISRESTINFFREMENIELIVVCKEVKKSEFRISFRSKQSINVANLAKEFNGGGHIRAAGATIHSTFSELNNQLLNQIRKHFL
tara:strand:+ start:491 stop:1420 length:930 start_codon:yes stop_codon:yes gene_type:complete